MVWRNSREDINDNTVFQSDGYRPMLSIASCLSGGIDLSTQKSMLLAFCFVPRGDGEDGAASVNESGIIYGLFGHSEI